MVIINLCYFDQRFHIFEIHLIKYEYIRDNNSSTALKVFVVLEEIKVQPNKLDIGEKQIDLFFIDSQ